MHDILKKIKQYHYKIVIDDFTEGINTYFLYNKLCETNKIYSKEISIVVEKIDTVNKAKWMRKFGLYRQQGYYWGKGSEKIEQLD